MVDGSVLFHNFLKKSFKLHKMAYNIRRTGEAFNTVGARRNQQPLGNNFVPGGQLPPRNEPGPGQTQNGCFGPGPQQFFKSERGPPPQQRQIQQSSQPITQDPNDIPSQDAKKPFWPKVTGQPKISKKERLRRRNMRLSKILQPKNAVMILNELVKSVAYTVTDGPNPAEGNQYSASVLVDGVSHVGLGRNKNEAKNMAAEAALKYIVKNRQYSILNQDEDGDVKMDTSEDLAPSMPWQHVASFALYKLLNAWGEDPNLGKMENVPSQNRPSKKMPDNAVHMNPLMLLNQMLPTTQFEELPRTGTPPNLIFTFNCVVNGQSFSGSGPNKKAAKKMAAFAICSKILGVQYPPEIYVPNSN